MNTFKFRAIYDNKVFGYERLTENGWEWMVLEINPDTHEIWHKGHLLNSYKLIRNQFTGLVSTDECSMVPKECYFGDIIRFYTTDGDERICEVMWYEKEHCIGFKRLSDGFVYTQRHFNDSGYFQPSKIQFEIIGNIYETSSEKVINNR